MSCVTYPIANNAAEFQEYPVIHSGEVMMKTLLAILLLVPALAFGQVPINEVVHIPDVMTFSPSTGAPAAADSTPTCSVYEEDTDTAILANQNMTVRTASTNIYRYSFTASAANGFEAGKWYNVDCTAVVETLTGKVNKHHFRIVPAETVVGQPLMTTNDITANAITAASINTGAITAAKFAAGAIDAASIATDAIGAAEIASAAIGADEIATDAIGALEIAAAAITVSEAPNLDAAVTSRLAPTVAARTLDVSAGGEAGIDWANVGSPTTTVGLTGTTISTGQAITSVSGAVGSVTGAVGSVTGTIGGLSAAALKDFFDTDSTTTYASAVAGSVVKEIADNSAVGASTALVTGTSDSGSTTTMVDAARTEGDADYWKGRLICFTSGTVSGQCATIEDFVPGTDTMTFKPALTATVSTQNYAIYPWASVLDQTLAEYGVAGTAGKGITDAASAGDPWSTLIPGGYTAGTAGSKLGRLPDIAVGSAGGLFIAGTNAATTVDLTGNLSGSVGSVTGAVGSVTGNVGGNVNGSVGSVTSISAAALDEIWGEVLTELSQGTPSATPSVRNAVMALYMAMRNQVRVTATSKTISNDAGTVIFKKGLTDDGTTFTEAEAVTGP